MSIWRGRSTLESQEHVAGFLDVAIFHRRFRRVADELIEKLLPMVDDIVVGDPTRLETHMGPVVSAEPPARSDDRGMARVPAFWRPEGVGKHG